MKARSSILGGIALGLLSLSLASCANALASGDSASAAAAATATGAAATGTSSSSAGSISLKIATPFSLEALAPRPFGSLASKSTGAKAIGIATAVKLDVLNGSGSVIATSTISINSMSGNTSANMSSVPSGSEYTVKATVYSSYTSSTEATVAGQVSGVSVTAGNTTSVSITCFPVSPVALILDTAQAFSLGGYAAEKWFTASVVSGTKYYLTVDNENALMYLFDGSGTGIAQGGNYCAYTANYAGTLYVAALTTSACNASIKISTTSPVASEGSATSPVTLTLNSPHDFVFSSSGSYYSFKTGAAGTYALSTDLVGGAWGYGMMLYSDSAFSSSVSSSSSYSGTSFPSLAANTTYYLKLVADSLLSISGTLMDPAAFATASASPGCDGSATSPKAITIGSPFAGKVGSRFWEMVSYYSFTTGSGRDYLLSLSSLSPSSSLLVGAISNGSASYRFDTQQSSGISKSLFLSPNTIYVIGLQSVSGAATYSISVSNASEPTYKSLGALGSWAYGSFSGSDDLWYTASLSAGTKYALYCNTASDGDGTCSANMAVSVYNGDRSSAYCSNISSNLYSSPQIINVPSGENGIRIRVTPNTSSGGSFALELVQLGDGGSLIINPN